MKFNLLQKITIGIGFVITTTVILMISKNDIDEPFKTALLIFVSSVFLTIISRKRFENTFTVFIISYAVSYVLFAFATLISAFVLYRFQITGNHIIIVILAGVIDIAIVIILSKVKTNINLMKKKGVGGTGLIISGITFIFYSLSRENTTDKELWLMMAGIGLTGYGIFYWWKRETVIAHNDNVNEIIKKRLNGAIDEKDNYIEQLKKAHDYMASTVHKDHKTLDALQRVIENIIKNSNQSEIIINARIILAEINTYRKHLSTDLTKIIYNGKTIPSTGLQLADAKFELLFEEATTRNIDVDLKINGNIKDITQIIPQMDLVNIIGNLVENAFIAIKHTGSINTYRGILINIGMVDGEYQLSVEDNGIPFEIDTLVNLGIKQVTTHSNEGGGGYGYITVFEYLKLYGASLIIVEYEPDSCSYSKQITIRFDGKENYIIKSSRAELIIEHNTNNNLLIMNLDG